MTNTTAWAQVTRAPGEPKASQFGGSDRLLTATVNGQEARIYIPCGGPIEHIAIGEQFVVEYRQGRWRYCNTQPPELVASLTHRSGIGQSWGGNPPPAPSGGLPPTPPAPPTQPSGGSPATDVVEWAQIFRELSELMPNTKEETRRAAASTIFLGRRNTRD